MGFPCILSKDYGRKGAQTIESKNGHHSIARQTGTKYEGLPCQKSFQVSWEKLGNNA